ncbi:hypothetical protein KACC15558_13500 [Brevibacterium ammoniilyticum]|uniref:DUF1345 domain-containing protein n=1 Tax=Brevibacterium ammoniilyticum TaxID=1046555 RepID=A0ABP9U4Z2_9MICO
MAEDSITVATRPSKGMWTSGAAQVLIVITCLIYLFTDALWALFLWEAVTTLYLVVGFIVVWRDSRPAAGDRDEARVVVKWLWVPPLLAALVGISAAITAMVAQGTGEAGSDQTLLLYAASGGIILSWLMLHIAFAEIYEVTEAANDDRELSFPTTTSPSRLDYLYFAYTIGTSFATSDVEVCGVPARRIVLLHSIVAFFYNALVVAVAFQVLQKLVSQG